MSLWKVWHRQSLVTIFNYFFCKTLFRLNNFNLVIYYLKFYLINDFLLYLRHFGLYFCCSLEFLLLIKFKKLLLYDWFKFGSPFQTLLCFKNIHPDLFNRANIKILVYLKFLSVFCQFLAEFSVYFLQSRFCLWS